MNKYNAAQRIAYTAVIAMGTGLVITGLGSMSLPDISGHINY